MRPLLFRKLEDGRDTVIDLGRRYLATFREVLVDNAGPLGVHVLLLLDGLLGDVVILLLEKPGRNIILVKELLEDEGYEDLDKVAEEILTGLRGEDITKYSEKQMADFRGKKCSMIFQDPMTSLNPVYTVGNQIREAILTHKQVSREAAYQKSLEMLKLVGINDAERRIRQYPHELSGGMRQRVMIAMALVSEPDILIADEPTTALDVTIQAQILELMQDLQKKLKMAIIIVTHDLGVIAQMADEIVVMYGGRICERGTADDIFYRPCHEYTKGLLRSIPRVDNMKEKLVPIGGNPINLLNMPKGCAFCARCDEAMKICLTDVPPELRMPDGHFASCWVNVSNHNYMEVPER